MAGKKSLSGREAARFAAVYGLPPGEMDYGAFVALALNEGAAMRVKALAMSLADGLRGEAIGAEWADAFSDSPEEGAFVLWDANSRRARAAWLARLGIGGSRG